MLKHGSIGSRTRLKFLFSIALLLVVACAVLLVWLIVRDTNSRESNVTPSVTSEGVLRQPTGAPQLSTEVIAEGLEHVWEVAFLPSGELLFTERRGTVGAVIDGVVREVAEISDVRAQGEGGLLGLTVDPAFGFGQNRYVYTCFNSTQGDVRVVRWQLAEDLGGLTDRNDIVTGIPANQSGRHSGCRLGFGPEELLWVTAGDAAMGATPQDPRSLGGKILRVTRDGEPASGNLGGSFDPRIYSYGHRNPQGLAFLNAPRDGVPGVSVEHGPDADDEVNLLLPGNFGWDPVPGYNESVPMTDKEKFPDAIGAIWATGRPTQAPSGATFVYGENWRGWNGALAVAMLRDQRLKFLFFDENWQLQGEEERFVQEFGRLRAAAWGPDESLYISTTNGSDDKIIRVIPE